MNKIEKIQGYKLSDGRIIEDELIAIRLQNEINFNEAVFEFAKTHGCYSDGIDDIYNAITDNKDELFEIFKLLNHG